jgi:hypothetical protein
MYLTRLGVEWSLSVLMVGNGDQVTARSESEE